MVSACFGASPKRRDGHRTRLRERSK
jgi:hypothetical protein